MAMLRGKEEASLADVGHGCAEEGFEEIFGGGIFFHGGLDGFLGDGARVAEVDESGECVVGDGAEVRARGRGGGGEALQVLELVFEFEDDAFGGFLADAGNLYQRGMVATADGGDEALRGDAAEDGDGELGTDTGDGNQALEETLFIELGEAEECKLVFGDLGEDVQAGFVAFAREGGEGGDGDGDVVANAGALDDGLVRRLGDEDAAEGSDHCC